MSHVNNGLSRGQNQTVKLENLVYDHIVTAWSNTAKSIRDLRSDLSELKCYSWTNMTFLHRLMFLYGFLKPYGRYGCLSGFTPDDAFIIVFSMEKRCISI
jgi:hypothetical protein